MKNPHIVAVDDNVFNLDLIDAILSSNQYDVTGFESGQEVVDYLEDMPEVDLFLLDVMMPGMTGFDLIKKIKEFDVYREVPVIFVTALTDSDNLSQGFSLGGVDYITKPIKSKELLARIHTHITLQQSLSDNKNLNDSLMSDLENAKKIQRHLLPGKFPSCYNLKFSGKYEPWIKVGGDFYDVFCTREKELFFYLADVSGHGVAAAMLTIVVKNTIRDIFASLKQNQTHVMPSEIISRLNQVITNDYEQYLTMILFRLSPDSSDMIYSPAGHHAFPIVFRDDQSEILENHSFPIGWINDATYEDFALDMNGLSRLFLYSDGIIEAENLEREMYGIERFEKFLSDSISNSIEGQVDSIYDEVLRFADGSLNDDFTILGVDFNGYSKNACPCI